MITAKGYNVTILVCHASVGWHPDFIVISLENSWMPAFAGMTGRYTIRLIKKV